MHHVNFGNLDEKPGYEDDKSLSPRVMTISTGQVQSIIKRPYDRFSLALDFLAAILCSRQGLNAAL